MADEPMTITHKAIERVARAICFAFEQRNGGCQDYRCTEQCKAEKVSDCFMRDARAALEATQPLVEVGELAGLVERAALRIGLVLNSAACMLEDGRGNEAAKVLAERALEEAAATLTSLMQENERMRKALDAFDIDPADMEIIGDWLEGERGPAPGGRVKALWQSCRRGIAARQALKGDW